VLLSTPLHASSNFTVSVQLANKRGFKNKNKRKLMYIHFTTLQLVKSKRGAENIRMYY
jgi:hypothetical protein